MHGLLESAPHLWGIPILINIPAFAIVALVTWLCLLGARESATARRGDRVLRVQLTGMVPSADLGKAADPLAYALNATGLQGLAKVVAFGAIFSMAAVLLVFQYGQPRIFFAMARDGLLPKWAARVDRKRRIPYVTTILTGVAVAVVLRHTEPDRPRPFRVPFVHVGLAIYLLYGFRHSHLRKKTG